MTDDITTTPCKWCGESTYIPLKECPDCWVLRTKLEEHPVIARKIFDSVINKSKVVNKTIKVLNMITEDMKNDAQKFDGKPFNGKTVAEYFGNQGAAIAALAKIVKSVLVKEDNV